MTIIYTESACPDTLVIETKAAGRRVVIKLDKESVAASIGNGVTSFRELSEAIASRIDEITSTHLHMEGARLRRAKGVS